MYMSETHTRMHVHVPGECVCTFPKTHTRTYIAALQYSTHWAPHSSKKEQTHGAGSSMKGGPDKMMREIKRQIQDTLYHHIYEKFKNGVGVHWFRGAQGCSGVWRYWSGDSSSAYVCVKFQRATHLRFVYSIRGVLYLSKFIVNTKTRITMKMRKLASRMGM